jgi:hypothetical protein
MVTFEDFQNYCSNIISSVYFEELVSRNAAFGIEYSDYVFDLDEGTELYNAGVRKVMIHYDNFSHHWLNLSPYVDAQYLLLPFCQNYTVISTDYDLKNGERLVLFNDIMSCLSFSDDIDMSKYHSYAPLFITSARTLILLQQHKILDIDSLTLEMSRISELNLAFSQVDFSRMVSSTGILYLTYNDYNRYKYGYSLGHLLNVLNEASKVSKMPDIHLVIHMSYESFLQNYHKSYIKYMFTYFSVIELQDYKLTKDEFISIYDDLDNIGRQFRETSYVDE